MAERIRDATDLEAALGAERFLLFKHSPICPTSAFAFAEYRRFLEEHPDTPSAWIDVIGQRPLSSTVAARTGVRHESPQALLVSQGAVLWHASHRTITSAALAQALAPQGE